LLSGIEKALADITVEFEGEPPDAHLYANRDAFSGKNCTLPPLQEKTGTMKKSPEYYYHSYIYKSKKVNAKCMCTHSCKK
jgi:hypothetical protein